MLHLFYGSDRQAAKAALGTAVAKAAGKGRVVVRVTDAHAAVDVRAALAGGGMFGKERVVILDGIMGGAAEGRAALLDALPALASSSERFFILEGALDAATRKLFEKHASAAEKFDAAKPPQDKTIFALANALQRGDKKTLWIGLMREYDKGSAPEAVHGLLFWGAKQMALKARGAEASRARLLVAHLAALPHEARRRGEDLGYALERFALSGM